MPASPLKPNRPAAERFLSWLDIADEPQGAPCGVFAFQVFDDDHERSKITKAKNKGFDTRARTHVGTLDAMWPKLVAANQDGCGVYVTINALKPGAKRRTRNDIAHVRAHFVEMDGGEKATPIDDVMLGALSPAMIVESSPGHFHVYWEVQPDVAADLEHFPARQERLAKMFGAGGESKDVSRVLRLPGFFHQKDPSSPFLVHIMSQDNKAPRYGIADFDAVLGTEAPEDEIPDVADDDDEAMVQWVRDYFTNDAPVAVSNTVNEETGKQGNGTTFDVMAAARDKGISEETCFALALEHYNPRCEPPWDYEELRRIVLNVYTYAQNKAGDKRAANDFETTPEEQAEFEAAAKAAKEEPKVKKSNERHKKAEKQTKGVGAEWVYVTQLDRFVERDDFENIWKAAQFNSHFGDVPRRKGYATLSKQLLETPGAIRKFKKTCYRPGSDEFGVPNSYNFYRKSDIEPVAGETAVWDDHLSYLFQNPRDADHVLNWMAWILQNMSKKPKHALLIAGFEKGTGKSFLAEVFSRLIGVRNVSPLGPAELNSEFNTFAVKSKLLLIEELNALEKRKAKDTLHNIITQERIPINEKGIAQYNIENCFAVMGMTNTDAAIPIEQGDRRYLVVRTFARPRFHDGSDDGGQQMKDYYRKLYGLLDSPAALGAIMYSLISRKITNNYSAADRAPDTEAKLDMIESAASELEYWMEENRGSPPLNGRVLMLQDVIDALPKSLERTSRLRPSIASILRHRFGGVQRPQCRLSNGRPVRLWEINGGVPKDTDDWNGSLGRAYERARDKWSSNKPDAEEPDAAADFED